jgi:hypothetical protein
MNSWTLGIATASIAGFTFVLLKKPTQIITTNPKLQAYLFAGRAFTTATALVSLGALSATMAVSYCLDVSSLKEFSIKMKQLMNPAGISEESQAAQQLLEERDWKEFQESFQNTNQTTEENPIHQYISQKVFHKQSN